MDQVQAATLTFETPGCGATDVAVFRRRTPLRLHVDQGALTILAPPVAVDG